MAASTKTFSGPTELLSRLYTERKLLRELFQARMRFDFRYDSRHRYDEQYRKYSRLTTTDRAHTQLINLIHHYRRTYDQEGYINLS